MGWKSPFLRKIKHKFKYGGSFDPEEEFYLKIYLLIRGLGLSYKEALEIPNRDAIILLELFKTEKEEELKNLKK